MKHAAFVGVILSASGAHADDVRSRYFGTSFRAYAGGGVEGHNVEALGQDFFAGVRLGNWASLEGVYAYQVQLGFSPPAPRGAFCRTVATSWLGDSYRWETVGLRAWFHLLHLSRVDVSVAPVIAAGFLVDRTSSCFDGHNFETRDGVFEAGLATALEVRIVPAFAIRAAFDTSITFGIAVAEVSGWLGPVFRF